MRSGHFWLLETAAYGLLNANSKWQNVSDNCFKNLGLPQCQQTPQLFYKRHGGKLILIAANIVDDIRGADPRTSGKEFIE